MAGTVSWDGLRELASFRAGKGCAISLYLDLDPRVAPTAGEAQARVHSLLDEGGRSHGANRSTLAHDERQALKDDFERIRAYFAHEFSRNGAHGFALFCAGMENVWQPLSLTESVGDQIRIGPDFHLTPLVPLVGRGEGALVAVVGREQGQLYRLRGGRLEQLADLTEEQPGRHDQGGWSQARYQRHIENLVQEHLRLVADELDRRVRRLRSPQVVIVSSEETRAEFAELVSNEVRSAAVGWTQAEAHAGPQELLEAATPELERWRAEQERTTVERWREEAGRNGRAAAGWEQTLEAASDGRVELLLFQDGAARPAWQCPQCGRAALAEQACPLDGTQMEPRDDGLDLAVHHTLSHGGKVWSVRHHHDLEPVEGIGALLRY
jgi:peptide chain release factor subunit 1